MLGIVGWYRAKSGPVGLRAYITGQAGDDVTLEASGLWAPAVGDTITDGTLSDTIVSVASPTSVKTRTATGFAPGFIGVTQRSAGRLRRVANFAGNVVLSDDSALRATEVVIGGGNTIEHILTSSTSQFHPDGWEFASIVLINPQDDGPPCLDGAHWASWQNAKLLVNVSATLGFAISDSNGLLPEDDIRIPGALGLHPDIFVAPGDGVFLVRHPLEDRWRASPVSNRELTFGVIADADNVIADADEVIVI